MKVLDSGYVKLVGSVGSDKRIAEVARISYGLEGELDEVKTRDLITRLINNGHLSPIEQVVFTFKVKCPIFIARQWMRHRTGSYNEQSRRYTKRSWEYYVPDLDLLPNDRVAREHIRLRMVSMYELQIRDYEDLIRAGVKPEMARGIMGTGFYTTFFFTMNLKNLLHFLDLRKDLHAQHEMQEYASAIELILEAEVPTVIEAWKNKK